MTPTELIWASDNPEWADVHCPASKVVVEDQLLHVHYGAATDDGGRYEGHFALARVEGIQSIEGEYTVYPPKGSADPFTQVVAFGLTGRIAALPDGGLGFSGIWDESGVAQAFTVGPLPVENGTVPAAPDADGYRFEALDHDALPAAWRSHAMVLQAFEQALWTYRHLVDGIEALAGFATQLGKIDTILTEAKTQFDRQLAGQLPATALLDYLRDEASLALEQALDEAISAVIAATDREAAPALATTIDQLAERIATGIQAEGYEVCRVWLGIA
jgi:hypothetical protein